MSANTPLLDVRNLRKYFPVKSGFLRGAKAQVKAVDDISFTIRNYETMGLVGESGCGKSTVGRTVLRLIEATSGQILFQGENILGTDQKRLREIRREIQIIFQDPYASLNPRMTVLSTVGEPLTVHCLVHSKKERENRVLDLLKRVGLSSQHLKRFPHEFSGGQRQRIGIARALAVNPKLIIADEPVSALDMSIQAQVINLLQDLQQEFGLTYLFISHDLSVVKHISTRVAVMYLGKIVELASKQDLFKSPLHPYSESLLSAIPMPDPRKKLHRIILEGDVPSPVNPPSGCRFHTRCYKAIPICREEEPIFQKYYPGHFAACHRIH